ncbi:hypothetical protein Ddc_17263 [Ditylenchus destructor]|nr:hypothetical protein Ddc_17263 [Ditylenchus destructor]
MDYFGIDHQGGFDAGEDIEDRDDDDDPLHYAPKRTSVPDLQPIFDFIKIYTGCDLINEPNTKCKSEHKEGRWRPYIDRNDPKERDEFPHKIPGRHAKGHLKIKSKRKFVKISYEEDDGRCEGDSRESFKHLFDTSIKDGPHFPIPRTLQNLIKVKKQGRDHQKFKIEINSGPSRVLLILTGKSKLWFRVHCYDCGAWVEIKANCEERVIKYSNGRGQSKKVEPKEGTIHVPLENNNSAESLERKESTEVKKQEPKGKSFGDWIIPPSVRKAVKKISSIKNVNS